MNSNRTITLIILFDEIYIFKNEFIGSTKITTRIVENVIEL